ncbi:MAG: C10 family peptidase, partial [Candidatus Cloacimonetes bacterium]|nr:C10 family peptidase [Candidatus Cloacimonadota bacterium]
SAATHWLNPLTNRDVSTEQTTVTLTSGDNGVTLFFTCSFQQGGFVIVAADDVSIPVLGYDTDSPATPDDSSPAFQSFINYYKQEISWLIETQASIGETRQQWDRLLAQPYPHEMLRDVAPLLSTEWNQSSPWNSDCPADASGSGGHVYAGCVAVAMAQVMNFWQHPAQGTGSHYYNHANYGQLSADFGSTTYLFNQMLDLSSTPSTELLLYHCGVAMEMDYGPNGSGAASANVPAALISYFNYSSSQSFESRSDYSDNAWEALLRTELEAGRPLYYRGHSTDGGHAWVCDGFQGTNYFHMNWGWSGSYDGYFYLNNLNPGTFAPFHNNQATIIGVEPSNSIGETEPNSFWDASGVLLVTNGSHTGNISNPADTDYWRFQSSAGDAVEVNTCASGLDTELTLYDTDGVSQLAYNDDDCGLQSRVTITTPADGTYYFAVDGFGSDTGNYIAELIGATTPAAASPAQADNPIPQRNSNNQAISGCLSWDMPGIYTDEYDLWFGPTGNMVVVETAQPAGATGSYSYTGTATSTFDWKVVTRNTSVTPNQEINGQTWTFTTACTTVTTLPWIEDFSSWPPSCWDLTGGTENWEHYNGEVAYADFWCNWAHGGYGYMTSPPIAISVACSLSWDWSHMYHSYYPDDVFCMYISNDWGYSWTQLWGRSGSIFDSQDGATGNSPGCYVTETVDLAPYAGQTVLIQLYGLSDWGPRLFVDNVTVFSTGPSTVYSQVKEYLEGAYDTATNSQMLNINGTLPLTSPYIDGLTVGAIPADIVDWVYVQLRATPTGAIVYGASYLLQDDGFIVDELGNPVGSDIPAGDYYVVVMHRNHLAAMSSVSHTFDNSMSQICNLTLDDACYTGSTTNAGVKLLETGVYGLIAGETTDPAGTGGTITDPDKGLINTGSGTSGYRLADINFSATVTDPDKGFINLNSGRTCQVPGLSAAVASGLNINNSDEIVEVSESIGRKQNNKSVSNKKSRHNRR